MRNLLDNFKCKSHVQHEKKSNLAEIRHEEKNKTVELFSRSTIVTKNHSACGQMVQCALYIMNSHTNKSKTHQDKSYFCNYYSDENCAQANKYLRYVFFNA